MRTPYDDVKYDFLGAFGVEPSDFDRWVEHVTDERRRPDRSGTEAAELLRGWAIAELKRDSESLASAGFDLGRPIEVARALTRYPAPRIWAALLGHTARRVS